VEVLRPARDDGAVNQIADGVLGNAPVTHHLVRPAVERNDPIEDAWMR
jgi:hypothetical protein